MSVRHVLHRAAPLATGAVLASAAVAVAVGDPNATNNPIPACVFRASTGLWCPGCGLTRGTHALLNGDIAGSLTNNLFTPLVLAAIVIGWWCWLRANWDPGRTRHLPTPIAAVHRSWPALTRTVLPAVVVLYGILRNVPVGPFRALAPN